MDTGVLQKKRRTCGFALVAAAVICLAVAIQVSLAVRVAKLWNDPYCSYDAANPVEETGPFVFIPDEYPDYMPLEVQVMVLESLGIQTPDGEAMMRFHKWMEEDAYYRAYMEGTPCVGILSEIGYGDYDGETDTYSYNPTVYWLDYEVWDIKQDYIDILNGLQAMGREDFKLSKLSEDCQNVDWKNGTGAILVMFHYNNHAYAFEAMMHNDRIDGNVIGFFNEVLEKEQNVKRFYYIMDEGQGAILFYNTEEWAVRFFEITGIELTAP